MQCHMQILHQWLQIYSRFSIAKMAAGRHLGFWETEIFTVRSAVAETPA